MARVEFMIADMKESDGFVTPALSECFGHAGMVHGDCVYVDRDDYTAEEIIDIAEKYYFKPKGFELIEDKSSKNVMIVRKIGSTTDTPEVTYNGDSPIIK